MKLTVAFLLLSLTVVGNSRGTHFRQTTVPDREVILKLGERVVIEDTLGNQLRVRFVAVPKDERCPEGAACLVPGNAKVELRFKSSNKESLSVILNTDDGPQAVELPGIRLTLIALNPRPQLGVVIDPKDYKATLSVSRPGLK